MPRRRTPQEKKKLSYERDRRNAYGENDKASRRNVPLAKRNAAQAYRKKINQLVSEIPAGEDAEEVAGRLGAVRRKGTGRRTAWQKLPDVPLGEWVAHQQQARRARFKRKTRARARRAEDEIAP